MHQLDDLLLGVGGPGDRLLAIVDEAAKMRYALLDHAVARCQGKEGEETLIHAEVDEKISRHLLASLRIGD